MTGLNWIRASPTIGWTTRMLTRMSPTMRKIVQAYQQAIPSQALDYRERAKARSFSLNC
ncbi:hypothetical protein D3C76_1524130 [compost metagenome]